MRLIDADALIRDIEHYHLSGGKFQHWVQIQPTIKPERKKGKWVLATNFPYGDDCYVCTNCKVKLDSMYPNFCPNCGADMREGEDE